MDNSISAFQIIVAAIQAIMLAALPAYFSYKSKRAEADAQKQTAVPNLMKAQADMQVEMARAAENLVEPLNNRIITQSAELESLRDVVRKQTNQIASLESELTKLRAENQHKSEQITSLQSDMRSLLAENQLLHNRVQTLERQLTAEKQKTTRLQKRLTEIKTAVDTGPLNEVVVNK